MNQDQNVSLELTIEEINTTLNALGNLPYIQVFGLIQKIQQQAGQQVQQLGVPQPNGEQASEGKVEK